MSATFTRSPGTGSVVPIGIVEYDVSRDARSIVHEFIGTDDVGVVLEFAGPRSGSLGLLLASLADAATAIAFFGTRDLYTLTDTDAPALNMQFAVTAGRITASQETSTKWLVRVPFLEVL